MLNFKGTYQRQIASEIEFQTYRDDNGAWLQLAFEGRVMHVALGDSEARDLGTALVSISRDGDR